MWMMMLVGGKWYGLEYDGESHLREGQSMDKLFAHVNNGEVVCVSDDLGTFCMEMDVDQEDVVIVELT